MPEIGLGELIVIAVLALLVFGDRLPKVAADAARMLRQVRQMATSARRELSDAAGLEKDPDLAAAVNDLRDLDPRRILEPLDEPSATGPGRVRGPGPGGSGSAASRASGPSAAAHPATSPGSSAPDAPAGSWPDDGTAPAPDGGRDDEPGRARPVVDPDWT